MPGREQAADANVKSAAKKNAANKVACQIGGRAKRLLQSPVKVPNPRWERWSQDVPSHEYLAQRTDQPGDALFGDEVVRVDSVRQNLRFIEGGVTG
jgi:hypothetical protein